MTTDILLIDDDEELSELLIDYLGREGFTLEAVHDGSEGLSRALTGGYALILLDVMLPGTSGFEVLRRLRRQSAIPVLMLTARGDDVDRIVGLEMGADDYLPKPFNPRELVARIRAIQRRMAQATAGDVGAQQGPLTVGEVTLDPGSREVTVGGEPTALTAVEFNLLWMLMAAAGTVVTREAISEQVLDRPFSPFDRSIDVHVSNLRKKLGQRESGEPIKTLRGVGYQYATD